MHTLPHAKGIKAQTGIAQCTSCRVDHANQNSPIGPPKLPIIAGHRLCSGLKDCAIPFFTGLLFNAQSMPTAVAVATRVPIAMAMNASPDCPSLNPYVLDSDHGTAGKKLYRMPKLRATYRLKKRTTGSVASMASGLPK